MTPIVEAFKYVVSDQYFWIAMSLTTIVGVYISAAIYDGETKELKKFMASLGAYIALILMTTYARISPNLDTITPNHQYQTYAGSVTLLLVTLFYLLGMGLGVIITRRAHGGKTS